MTPISIKIKLELQQRWYCKGFVSTPKPYESVKSFNTNKMNEAKEASSGTKYADESDLYNDKKKFIHPNDIDSI